MRGRFITFEGGEGSGKSTQARMLYERLNERGFTSILTREPGGSPIAEEIRKILIEGPENKLTAWEELLLFMAARLNHYRTTIEPALEAGKHVISDRYIDSSIVYQCLVGSVPVVDALHLVERSEITYPDTTFILDIPTSIGLERAEARGVTNRFELRGATYHQRVRQGFLEIQKFYEQELGRWFMVLDGTQSKEYLSKIIFNRMVVVL